MNPPEGYTPTRDDLAESFLALLESKGLLSATGEWRLACLRQELVMAQQSPTVRELMEGSLTLEIKPLQFMWDQQQKEAT